MDELIIISENLFLMNKLSAYQDNSHNYLYDKVATLKNKHDHTPSIWPLYGSIIASFGFRTHPILGRIEFHSGLDIPSWVGAPIKATASGVVESASWFGGYGLVVVIDHKNRFKTMYAHNSQMLVQPGEEVEKGQVIALVGSTGLSTGPHLHYEVRYANKPVNPALFLNLSIFQFEKVVSRIRS